MSKRERRALLRFLEGMTTHSINTEVASFVILHVGAPCMHYGLKINLLLFVEVGAGDQNRPPPSQYM